MKGKIFDIKRFAVHDGDGIRTTVFFKGCPLNCIWCHNPEGISFASELAYYDNLCSLCGECSSVCCSCSHIISDNAHLFDRNSCISCGECESVCARSALKFYGREYTVEQLMKMLISDKDFYETSGGGVTVSGGECMCQVDFLVELLTALKKEDVSTAVDTCGYVPKGSFDRVMPYTDIFLYDIKAFDEQTHIKCTGVSNKLIIDNLKYIDACGAKTEIRIPYVPGYNSDQIKCISEFIYGLKNVTKVRILPYHNYAGSKYSSLGKMNTLPEILPTDDEIVRAKEIALSYGITVAD